MQQVMNKKKLTLLSKVITYLTVITTFISMTGLSALLPILSVSTAMADEFVQQQFWIQYPNGISPSGGNIATSTFSGFVNFSGPVNAATATYSSANASSSSIILLQGNYMEDRFFRPDSPDAIQLADHDVPQLAITTTNAALGKINFTVPNDALLDSTTYTIAVRGVCASGHAQGDWQYCATGFQTFTTVGSASANATVSMAPGAFSLCSPGISLFANDTNKGIYSFNAFGAGTLNSVKFYSNINPSSIISNVKLYRDKTSTTDSNGNWNLEPGIDTLLGSGNTWSADGGVYSLTLTLNPAFTLPSTNPNGSLGFIAIDMNPSATAGTSFHPILQSGSFTFSAGDDAAVLTTAMNSAIAGLNCASPTITVTSAGTQASPYVQNMAPSTPMAPMQQSVALGIDFWSASAAAISSMQVHVITSTSFDPQYGLNTLYANNADSGLNIYRDNKVSGTIGSFDGQDTRIVLASAPVWSSSNMTGFSKKATLTFASPIAAPLNNTGSNASPDYFVVIKTSSSPASGATFQVKIPANGVVAGFPANDSAISSAINIQSGGGMMASNILISEVLVGLSGFADKEFVELYNPTSNAVDLSAYKLHIRNSVGTDTNKTLDFTPNNNSTVIPAYGFFLIASADYGGSPDATYYAGLVPDGSVYISTSATALTSVVDKIGWGDHTTEGKDTNAGSYEGEPYANPAAGQSIERKSWYQATAASMASGGMDVNMGNFEDSQYNLMNFVTQNTPVPQNTSSAVENPMANQQGGSGSPVVINEVYYYPATGATAWIELFNRTASAVTINGWTLKVSDWINATANNVHTFPALSLPANSYVTIWWNQDGTDTANDKYTSHSNGTTVSKDMSTLSGDIILKDGGTIKDYVQYGAINQPNETTANSAAQWVDDHVVSSVLNGQSIGRKGSMGDDSNRGDDWQTYTTPSEGNMNSGGDDFPPSAVTGVTLTDGDIVNYGINGQDVTVAWTANATTDSTFEKYLIYILPSATTLNTTAHIPFAEIYSGQTTASFTGNPGQTKDSQNPVVSLSAASYRAYVVAQDHAGNRSSGAVSAAASLSSADDDTHAGTDTQKPFIMHMNVGQAKAGADLVLLSRFSDDRALDATPGAGAQIVWQAADTSSLVNMVSGTATTTTNCISLEANYYRCTIPAVNAAQGHVVAYYLKSADSAGNTSFMSASPTADMATYANVGAYRLAVSQHPFIIDILAATEYEDALTNADLSGTIYQNNGSAIQDAYVFMEGTASGWASTTASGVFTIADNKMMAGSWPVVIFKSGYMDMYANAFRGDSGLSYYLNSGEMHMGGAGASGGYMDMPNVIYTNPGDGMNGIPTENFTMNIGFSKPMDGNTIIDNDTSNAGSNIYLTTDGTNRVAGAIAYNSNTHEATFTVASGTALTPGTHYTLVITTAITDDMGNPIAGGWRSDGAYESGFNTMMNNDSLWGTGWKDGQVSSGGDANYFGGMNFDNYGTGGQMMPPFVKGTVPNPGAFSINNNRSITIEFSEAMDSASITTTNIKLYPISNKTSWTMGTVVPAAVSLDSSTQRIVTLNPTSNLNLNTDNDGWYVLKIMGAVKSANGIWLGDPKNCGTVNPDTCLATTSFYESSFQLNSDVAGDAANPTIQGTFPQNSATGIDVGISSIDIGFSEPMSPDTITAQNITLTAGSKSITGKVKYDPMSNNAKFMPANALIANTQYTLSVATSTTDLAGRYLNSAQTISFKTGSADTTSPTVMYANADDFSIAITFSEPMISAKQTDANLWTYSILNPANYYVNGFTVNLGENAGSWSAAITLRAPYNTTGGKQLSELGGLNFDYDEPTNTVTIKGLAFNSSEPHATDFQIFVDNVRDKSNNAITDTANRQASVAHGNAGRGPVQNSANTYGMLGPGGGGMMMMGAMGGGGPVGPATGGQTGPGMNMSAMGMMKAGAFPMNAMAGQNSMYFIDVPITKQILSGGKIVLTFPSGFNVASAQQDIYSPVNKDFNNFAQGTVTFACSDTAKNCAGGLQVASDDTASSTKGGLANDGVSINSSSRIVNIHTNGNTLANDFLHIDLKGIINSSIPKEFGTDGYTVDIKTMSPEGTLLENITTMPFFINQGGSSALTVTVNCGNTDQDSGTMTVFLGSPMTGPMEAISTAFSNGIATSIFSSIPNGQYNLFTDPYITIGSNTYLGKPMPEPITVSGATSKTISIEKEGAGAGKTAVTIILKGNFSSSGVNDQVDIFANSPSGFRVKTVAPNADDAVEGDASEDNTARDHITKYTLYLTNGHWMVGMGPATPKGPMAGPPKMPDWMPPMNIDVDINSLGIPVIRENNGTANDGIITLDISNQSLKSLAGKVTDGVATSTYPFGTPIANAEVYAYQPNGGFGGAHTTSATDGTFTLKIPVIGMYKVGTFKQGLPDSKETTVDIRDAGNYDDKNTAITAVNGVNPFILKLKKPAYTISGKVLNRSSQAIAYTPVWAWQSSGTGHADTMTDSSGNYILYVDNGTWNVETDAPGVGWMQYDLPITVNGASQANINLKPTADASWYDISGTITIGGTAQSYMPIRAVEYDVNGNYLGKEYGGSTDSNGAYTINVKGTGSGATYKYYRVDIWTPDYGEVGLSYDQLANSPANIKVSNAATTTANILIASQNLKTAVIEFANYSGYSNREAFIHIDGVSFSGNTPSPTGFHKSLRMNDVAKASTTVSLATGNYFFFTDVPGTGGFAPVSSSPAFDTTKGCIVIDGTGDTINFTLPDQSSAAAVITITGTVSGPASGQKDAWVWIGNTETGFNTGTNAASTTGAYSLTVPKLSSGKYIINADKPGYISGEPTQNTGTANTTVNFTLTAFSYTISGKIYADASGGTTNSYDSGEEKFNGWVSAKETATSAEVHAPVDSTGSYVLGINNGTWKVYGSADGYSESQYSVSGVPTTLTVANASLTGKNIKLTADTNWSMKSKSKPIAPSSGGVVDDTAQNTTTGKADGTGVKLTVPPNALGSSSSNGNISTTETSAVAATNSMKPFGGKAKNITATDNSGQAITNLNDYVDMEMVIYKADIEAETDVIDFDKLKTMKIGYWDDTSNAWINLPTTEKAFYKMDAATDWTQYNGTTTPAVISGFDKFINDALGANATLVEGTNYDDYKFVFTASTNHFSVFALGTSPDGVAPSAPTAVAQSSGSGTSVILTWTAPTTNSDSTALTDLYGYAVYKSTDGAAYAQANTSRISSATYTDSGLTAWTSYYYKITAGDDDDTESAYSAALQLCSTKTVSNGTVAANCAITCNSGYTQSGYTCVASSSGGGGVVNLQQQQQQTQTTETKKETTEIKKILPTPETTAEETKPTTFSEKIKAIISEAKTAVLSKVNDLLTSIGVKRNMGQEQKTANTLVKPLLGKIKNATREAQYAATNFITYGTETTKSLGEGERAGVLHSFQKAYDRIPKDDNDWQDAIKIANGRFPSQQSIDQEKEALKVFGKIYKKMPDFKNAHDEAALKIIAYGIRPVDRRVVSEKAAILSFRNIYGRNPSETADWDIMRAIAYSGATR